MVNKRFTRKFRRALGAALGALSVASISNIETIGAAFTETSLAGDADLKWTFKLNEVIKKAIYNNAEALFNNARRGELESGKTKFRPLAAQAVSVELSFPVRYNPVGHWDGAYVVSFKHQSAMITPHPLRVTVMKSRDFLDGEGSSYLIAPAMTEKQYIKYATTHEVPRKGNWTAPGFPRGAHTRRYLKKLNDGAQIRDILFHDRNSYELRDTQDPANPANPWPDQPVGPLGAANGGAQANYADGVADRNYLTRWHYFGLMDVSIWNDILGDDANKHKMYCDINTCPPELRDFYYPPEKKEDTTINSSSAPVPASSTMNMAPVLTALAPLTAVTMATTQPTAPYSGVSPHNVTPGSADVGPTSQTGSDVKPTNVQHDAKSKSDSNEPLKT